MEKKDYLRLRKELKLSAQKNMLLKHMGFDALLVSVLVSWCVTFAGSWLVAFAALLVPVIMFRSFAMMHEASHGVAAKEPVNFWVGTLYGGMALLAYDPWKKSHLEHHYWSGNVEKDPVMALMIAYPKFPNWLQKTLSYSWQLWLPILAVLQHMVFWMLSFKKLSADHSWKMVVSTAWPMIFWSTVFSFTPTTVVFSALIPGMVIYLMSVEIVNLPHHLRLQQETGDTRLAIWEQYRSARSCVYPKFLARFVTLNFNYHTEHHMFPDVAWYHLDEVHDVLKSELGTRMNLEEKFTWTLEHRDQDLGYVVSREVGAELDQQIASKEKQSG